MSVHLKSVPVTLLLVVAVSGCWWSGPEAPVGTAQEIADKVFAEAGVEPFGFSTSLTSDQEIEDYLGSTNYPAFSDTVVVRPMTSLDARVLYILKLDTRAEAVAVVEQLEVDVDPQRLIWITFASDDVVVGRRGTVVFMVIDSDEVERAALIATFTTIG